MSNAYLINAGQSATVFVNGESHVVSATHPQFDSLVEALKVEDWDVVSNLVTPAKFVESFSAGNVKIENDNVFYKGEVVHNTIVDRILAFFANKLPFEPLVQVLENLVLNPSRRSVEQLYQFLEHKYLPVTADGCFLAYKAVKSNYDSKTAGSENVRVSVDGGKNFQTYKGNIPNPVGAIVEVDRNKVDDNPNSHCSYGLHAGSIEYVKSFRNESAGDKIIVVKINPRDVVSIPNDCSCQKLRACRYEVVADYRGVLTDSLVDALAPYGDDWEDFDASDLESLDNNY